MLMQCGNRTLDLSTPKIMGILNVTPDSFSDAGQLYSQGKVCLSAALKRATQMVLEGAAIVDVGGESTRPGALAVGEQEELDRVLPIIENLTNHLDVIISVDTSCAAVIHEAAKLGAGVINDVRALQRPNALEAAAHNRLPVCLMHMQGEPTTMQHQPDYSDVIAEVSAFFHQRLHACRAAGIDTGRVILDPGIGFGKTDAHNLALLNHLREFNALGCPLLVGLSRKSMLGRLLQRELPDRLAGSLGFGLIALQRGANILRVHDVAATADIVKIHQLTTELASAENQL